MAFTPHAGAVALGIYRLTRMLGRGGFGEVWEAIAPGDIPKAVKIVSLDDSDNDSSLLELDGLRTMRSVRHPYLLSLDRFEVVDGTLFMVSELAEKSLADRKAECQAAGERGIPRGELLQYMKEAAEALDFLVREHRLQHLDVKPANLFLSAGHIKVADFSLVRGMETEMTSATMAFSPVYAAPEVFDGQVTRWSDQYSLAVTYQELLTGTRPYTAPDLRGLIALHLEGRPELSLLPAADRIAAERALSRDAERRYPTCRKFVDQLIKAAFFGEAAVNLARVGTQPERPARQTAKTVAAGPATPAPGAANAPPRDPADADFQRDGKLVETFLAFVPLEIYARKLRGFVDEMKAEIVSCNAEKIVMLFRPHSGWLGLRRNRGLFLQVDAVSRETRSGYRAVETAVWPTGKGWEPADVSRRARTLTRLLRAFLIASDNRPLPASAADMRAKLLA
jgi:hypothetical protein